MSTTCRFRGPTFVSAALLFALALGGCSSGGGAASPCDELASCCAGLGALASTCAAEAQAAAAAGTVSTCADTLASYTASGLCTGAAGTQVTGFSNDAGTHEGGTLTSQFPNDTATGVQAPVCARYLSCIGAVAPSELPQSLAAYGPDGTCWNEGASASAACVTACTNGIQGLHESNPETAACPLCAADSDCAGGTVCSVALGRCVMCTSDAQCGGSHCDPSTSVCVGCVDDSQCTSAGATHCGPASTCVGCVDGSQCASQTCNPDGTCCVPKTCAEQFPDMNCGTVDDGCGGTVSCGTCARGYCGEGDNVCTAVGVACTPIVPNDCPYGETCAADAWHQDYRCSPSLEGQACQIYPSDTCAMNEAYMGEPVDDYTCVTTGGVSLCAQNCLTSTDCASGQTCTPYMNTAITPGLPGQCLPPG